MKGAGDRSVVNDLVTGEGADLISGGKVGLILTHSQKKKKKTNEIRVKERDLDET